MKILTNAAMAAALCSTSFSVPAIETEVLLYNAFSAAPSQTTLVPAESLQGECLTHSQVSPREDAWRCMSGSRLFDPCYVRTYVKRNEVICPTAPWLQAGIQIALGHELPQPTVEIDAYQQLPWAMQLVNGKYCKLVNAGNHPQFQCEGYGSVGDTLHRCKGLWRIIMKSPEILYTQTEQIAKVWY